MKFINLNIKKLSCILASLILLPSMLIFGSGCGSLVSTHFALDTIITLKLEGGDVTSAETRIIEMLDNLEQNISTTIPTSDVSLVNNSTIGMAITVSNDTLTLVKLAHDMYDITNGAYNPTMQKVSALWGFGTSNKRVPENSEIADLMSFTSFQYIEYNEDDLTITRLSDKVGLDFGGIAKGYAANKARNICNSCGVTRAVIDLGGNIYMLGVGVIGIASPRDGASYLATLNINNMSVVTSGDYQRYFEIDNIRYHHILDRMGYPTNNGLIAVTVIGEDSAVCDALSTAIMVLGQIDGTALLEENYEEYTAVMVSDWTYSIVGNSSLFKLYDSRYSCV